MDASMFSVGDRIELVKMNDPHRKPPIGIQGTVIGIAPKPINVLNVDWDEPFSLNPCLDVDVVRKLLYTALY